MRREWKRKEGKERQKGEERKEWRRTISTSCEWIFTKSDELHAEPDEPISDGTKWNATASHDATADESTAATNDDATTPDDDDATDG